MRWKLSTVVCLVFSAGLLATSCVYRPYDGESVVSSTPIEFNGYAANAGDAIAIQAFNKAAATWDTVGTTAAVTCPTTHGTDSLYAWHYAVDLNALPTDWRCYWSTSCNFPSGGTYNAEFKVKEGTSITLPSFDSTGIDCVVNGVRGGDGWLNAGLSCQGPNSPTLNLKMHIVI